MFFRRRRCQAYATPLFLSLFLSTRPGVAFGSTFVFFDLFFSQIFFLLFLFFFGWSLLTDTVCRHNSVVVFLYLNAVFAHTTSNIYFYIRCIMPTSLCLCCAPEYVVICMRISIGMRKIQHFLHWSRTAPTAAARSERSRVKERKKNSETCYFWRCRNAPHYVFTFDITRARSTSSINV